MSTASFAIVVMRTRTKRMMFLKMTRKHVSRGLLKARKKPPPVARFQRKKRKMSSEVPRKAKKAFVVIAEVAEVIIKVRLNRTNSLLTNLQECYLDLTNYS